LRASPTPEKAAPVPESRASAYSKPRRLDGPQLCAPPPPVLRQPGLMRRKWFPVTWCPSPIKAGRDALRKPTISGERSPNHRTVAVENPAFVCLRSLLNRRAGVASDFSFYLFESDLRRTVTSIIAANSAMNMMITMMIVLVFIIEASSTAAGLVRRCGSSSSGQRSRIVATGGAGIAAMLFPICANHQA
jgi:hypothetical protein